MHFTPFPDAIKQPNQTKYLVITQIGQLEELYLFEQLEGLSIEFKELDKPKRPAIAAALDKIFQQKTLRVLHIVSNIAFSLKLAQLPLLKQLSITFTGNKSLYIGGLLTQALNNINLCTNLTGLSLIVPRKQPTPIRLPVAFLKNSKLERLDLQGDFVFPVDGHPLLPRFYWGRPLSPYKIPMISADLQHFVLIAKYEEGLGQCRFYEVKEELEELEARHLNLTKIPPQILALKHLRVLNLKNNAFSEFPVEAILLEKLEVFHYSLETKKRSSWKSIRDVVEKLEEQGATDEDKIAHATFWFGSEAQIGKLDLSQKTFIRCFSSHNRMVYKQAEKHYFKDKKNPLLDAAEVKLFILGHLPFFSHENIKELLENKKSTLVTDLDNATHILIGYGFELREDLQLNVPLVSASQFKAWLLYDSTFYEKGEPINYDYTAQLRQKLLSQDKKVINEALITLKKEGVPKSLRPYILALVFYDDYELQRNLEAVFYSFFPLRLLEFFSQLKRNGNPNLARQLEDKLGDGYDDFLEALLKLIKKDRKLSQKRHWTGYYNRYTIALKLIFLRDGPLAKQAIIDHFKAGEYISFCIPMATIPKVLFSFKDVKYLRIYREGRPLRFEPMPKLEYLELHYKRLKELPNNFECFPALNALYLGGTIYKELPTSLSKLENLKSLYLYQAYPSSKRSVTQIPNLKQLFVYSLDCLDFYTPLENVGIKICHNRVRRPFNKFDVR